MSELIQKLLLVEDEEVLRRVTSGVLAALGVEVTTAQDGLEALELVKKNQFDVIVSDIAMPNMNGLDFLRAARNCGYAKPFLFLTGYGGPDFEAEAKQYGVFAYMSKPYRKATHAHVVLEALKLSREGSHAK